MGGLEILTPEPSSRHADKPYLVLHRRLWPQDMGVKPQSGGTGKTLLEWIYLKIDPRSF